MDSLHRTADVLQQREQCIIDRHPTSHHTYKQDGQVKGKIRNSSGVHSMPTPHPLTKHRYRCRNAGRIDLWRAQIIDQIVHVRDRRIEIISIIQTILHVQRTRNPDKIDEQLLRCVSYGTVLQGRV